LSIRFETIQANATVGDQMTKKEAFAAQDEILAAFQLALEMIPAEERLALYTQAEWCGCSDLLDRVEPPRGKKDIKSYRQLLCAFAVEAVRRATSIEPLRVRPFQKS
jgi:hypothetical protein